MKRATTETMLGSVVEKPLLRLHAASSIEPFWIAVRGVIEVVLPGSLAGLTLQHHPISPLSPNGRDRFWMAPSIPSRSRPI